MKKRIALALAALMVLCLAGQGLAESAQPTGELVIYSSMYPYVLEMLDGALREAFPGLTPGNDGSFFVYGGSSALINTIYQDMKTGTLGCDMMLVAEPSLSLELKEAGYLAPVAVEDAARKLRFPYDEEGYWYPVRVCSMVLAYNPEMEEQWAARGVTIPRTFGAFASDPALKGLISMNDPLFSGTTFAALASLIQANHYGRQYLRKLAANEVAVEPGKAGIERVQKGECAAVMILEESVLKVLEDAEKAGAPLNDIRCIYPEDGVILIPSTVMTVAPEHSRSGNLSACEAVERWFLSEEAQRLILQGYMHSVFTDMQDHPYGSVETEWLIGHDMQVKWENAYRGREDINQAWVDIVMNKTRVR